MHFTSPHSCHRTTLFNSKVLNYYKTQVGDGVRRKIGCTEIHFIESGVKMNWCSIATTFFSRSYFQTSYPRMFFVFKQDGATSTQHHRFPGAKGARRLWPLTLTKSIIASGVETYCRRKFTDPEFLTSINLKCVCSTSGHALTSRLWMLLSTSGCVVS